MKKKKVPRSIGTHDGTFHADEVTACALLLLFDLADKDKIVRTREAEKLAECDFVCDVGGEYNPKEKLFDHHQSDYDGLWSSAGMILHYLFAEGILEQKAYDFFNDVLVLGVDAHDNGRVAPKKGHASFSHVIANMTPIRHDCSTAERNEAFLEAVDFVLGHLRRLQQRYEYHMDCQGLVEVAMKPQELVLEFDRSIPWLESFFELGGEGHPALFVVMPAGEHWKLRGVPPTYARRMEVRQPLPEEWAGCLEGELKEVSGIPGAIFCHKGRFVSVWETREDVFKALHYVLKKKGSS